MDLSIITVTYQSRAYIGPCILSVLTHTTKLCYEHIVIDNSSTDGTVALLEESYLPYITLIKNSSNVGFAQANNEALKAAKGRWILFLNPDTELHEGSLDDFIAQASMQPRAAILGCKLIGRSYLTSPHLRPMKTPFLRPYLLSFLGIEPFFCTIHKRFFYKSFQDDLLQEVDILRGSFLLMPRTFLHRVGYGFNPSYFLLFEDVDICRRARQMGYQVLYNPSLSCIDFTGRSFSQKTRPWKYLQMAKSFTTYVKTWHSPWHLLWIYPVSFLGFLLRIPQWGFKNSCKAFFPFS